MPKMKTHRGTKKRVKVTGTGKFVVKHSGTNHIMTKKSKKRKNKLRGDMVVEPGKARKIKKLLPTGEGR
ncbi:50S ribosomal protein L35 [Haliovirga abyssi]|uniref:Large ribosomal subunit protein bL35 n=1 Tax=Haliovirga abyssi TaxID=2996794 RepID=A0AAU9DQQ2_9FUSO|nr:50S ribosomal protein L35 [Haliovirga abyssi]BDU50818.1 50S ribosomal protein L35 [Haliovirga abyssi]